MPESRARDSGTVTFLFTDIEGSTRLLEALGTDYADVLARHHSILRQLIAQGHGTEVKTEGDSFFVIFHSAVEAVGAAVGAQRALAAEHWPAGHEVRVRMGLHTGEVDLVADEYVGLDVHRAARVEAAAHGGQVLITGATRDLVRSALPEGVSLRDMGEHRLRDLERPEHLYQLVVSGLANDFGPLRTMSVRLDLLPRDLTSFVGRDNEMARVIELLRDTRLLTLTGPGGTGKTRLAVEAARRAESSMPDGAAFVALASIRDPMLVGSTIRQALGLAEEPGTSGIDTVIQQMRTTRALLVLDNLEQLPEASPTLAKLLEGTVSLKLLATSRSPLHISGEQEFPVPPLGLPDVAERDNSEAASRSEAVRLFVQRARTVRPDFEITAGNVRAIVDICERLDGLPLAIELAASRIRLLPPEALLTRLSHRLDLLQSSAADRTDRQRTLRGAIDWSHELLGNDERATFRRCSIFLGGFELAAAEAVVPAAGLIATDLLDDLASLVEHSLVRQDETTGEPRFTMLESIREYGLEQLAGAKETKATGAAHASYYLSAAIELSPSFTRGEAALNKAEREHDNIRSALRWAIDSHMLELAMEAAGALWRFWHLRGHLREGERTLAEVLAKAPESPSHGRARALYGKASLTYWRGDYEQSRREYEQCLKIAEDIADDVTIAEAHYAVGFVQVNAHDYDGARASYEASRVAAARTGDELSVANAIFGSAFVDAIGGPYEDAVPKFEQVIPAYERVGDRYGWLNAQSAFGRVLQLLGRLSEARRYHLVELDGSIEMGDRTMTAMAFHDLGAIALEQGEIERGLQLEGASRAIGDLLGGGAPPELVKANDPEERALASGMAQAEVDRIISQGRALSEPEAVALARREVAG
jgi:predicted ATPase/class 3 adenylate cyclase